MTRVGFTGTSRGLTPEQRRSLDQLLNWLRPEELHHGDCVGADAAAHDLVVACRRVGHPPVDPRARAFCRFDEERRPLPYLERNRRIVAETELLVACPAGLAEALRSGTWATVRAARRLGRPVALVWPDGRVEWERGPS